MNWFSGLRKKFSLNEKAGDQPGRSQPAEGQFIVIPKEEDEAAHAGEPPSKDAIIQAACYYTCSKVCYGVKGQAGICCTIGERDYIIGPIDDTERFLQDLSAKLGRIVKYKEVFIDFEEGSKLFPEKKLWQNPDHYPCMRVIPDRSRGYPCQFLSSNMKCMVHSIKPAVCRNYLCPYLKEVVHFMEESLNPSDDEDERAPASEDAEPTPLPDQVEPAPVLHEGVKHSEHR